MADNFDTDAAGILIGTDSCDLATALAASYRPQTSSIVDSEPQPATYSNRFSFDLGLIVGLALFLLYMLLA